MKFERIYKKWLSGADENTVFVLKNMSESEKQDSFYKDIEFGTGGMRGLLGPGTNRINKYTVAKATKGFAEYIKANGEASCKRGVVIAHDNRRQSRELSEITAGVLAYEGIKVYLFEDLRTTPELSFAVRHLGCFGGVVITASRNTGDGSPCFAGVQICPKDPNIKGLLRKSFYFLFDRTVCRSVNIILRLFRKHRSALADTKRGCLPANDVMLCINDVGFAQRCCASRKLMI